MVAPYIVRECGASRSIIQTITAPNRLLFDECFQPLNHHILSFPGRSASAVIATVWLIA